jgi:hypothetical protein
MNFGCFLEFRIENGIEIRKKGNGPKVVAARFRNGLFGLGAVWANDSHAAHARWQARAAVRARHRRGDAAPATGRGARGTGDGERLADGRCRRPGGRCSCAAGRSSDAEGRRTGWRRVEERSSAACSHRRGMARARTAVAGSSSSDGRRRQLHAKDVELTVDGNGGSVSGY